jgi:tetratricopeptide (TPR) repeat protein
MGRRFEDLLKGDPSVADWRYRLSENRASLARLLADMGQRDAAIQAWSEASALIAPLIAKDPDNRDWQAISLVYRLQQIALRGAAHERGEPASAIEEIRLELERLLAKEPTSPVFAGDLALSWLVQARWLTSSASDMLAAAEHSLGYSEPLIQTKRADPLIHSYFVQACLLAGRAEEQLGRHDKATTHWQRVVNLLAAVTPDSNDSRLLDPLAQAYMLLGDQESARPLIARLKRLGYQSIDPVAVSTLGLAQKSTKP